MMTTQTKKLLFVLMLGLMVTLAACGGVSNNNGDSGRNNADDEASENPQPDDDGLFDIDDFDTEAKSGDPIDGGELTYGLVTDTAFEGTLNRNFYDGEPDDEILDWMAEGLVEDDENFVYNDDGIASTDVNEDDDSITFTLEDDVKWSDGEPLTAEDLAFSYKVLAHPDYDGVRYGNVSDVVGLGEDSDWHNQDTDEDGDLEKIDTDEDIEGIDVEDDQTITITYDELTPSTTTGGAWPYPMAKHIFEDIPVAEMSESDEVRKNPVGLGPYVVDDIVSGESVTLKKNDHYWRGEPNLDKVTIKVVDPSNLVKSLETGEIDMASFEDDLYADNYDDLNNVQFLGTTDLAYSYIGFKLGDWDKDENRVNNKPDDMKMGDPDLREAMWYAIDTDAVGDEFYDGLRWGATTLIDPAHDKYHDDDIETPDYDPDKAEEILDEAGYEYDDDGEYRLDPDGDELTINYAAMSGEEVAEPMAKYYMQAWKEVGLDVQLYNDRLMEFNSFYDKIGQEGDDDPDIDIFSAGFGTASDVDPSMLWGPTEIMNLPRFESEESDELLDKGLSKEAFDTDYREDVYDDWQELMVDEIPAIPTLYRPKIEAVNDRVVNYDIAYDTDTYLYELGVTEDEPETAE